MFDQHFWSVVSAEGSAMSPAQDVVAADGRLLGKGYQIVKVHRVEERSPATTSCDESNVRFSFGVFALPSAILDSLCLARQFHWKLQHTAPWHAVRSGFQELLGYVANNIDNPRNDQRTLEAVEQFLVGWAKHKVSE